MIIDINFLKSNYYYYFNELKKLINEIIKNYVNMRVL